MLGFFKKDKPDNSFVTTPPASSPASNVKQPVDPDDFFGKQAVPVKNGSVDPDDFFARPERPKKTQQAQEVPAEIDTETLNTDQVLDADAEAKAARRMNIKQTQGIETDSLNTDQILDEDRAAAEARRQQFDADGASVKQEAPAAAGSSFIDPDDFFARPKKQKSAEVSAKIDTDTLNTDQVLDADAEAKAARRMNVEKTQSIDTDVLNADQVLDEDRAAAAARRQMVEETAGIDTSAMEIEGLREFQFNYDDDEEDDSFDFSNDVDYEVTSAPALENI